MISNRNYTSSANPITVPDVESWIQPQVPRSEPSLVPKCLIRTVRRLRIDTANFCVIWNIPRRGKVAVASIQL